MRLREARGESAVHCDVHHSKLCRRAHLAAGAERNIGTSQIMKAMDGRAHFRKLICVVGALLVMGAPILGSLCAAGDCSGRSLKADARCTAMAMPQSATSINAESRLDCCQMNPGLPAAFRESTDTGKAKAEFSSAPLGTALQSAVARRSVIAGPVDSSPPDDVQSLFCTLLI